MTNRPAKRKKVNKESATYLKKKLDNVFSKYIRAKYKKECYTCGSRPNVLQCGHFVSRLYLATRWDENNCRPQCAGCNIWGRGQLLDFEENLIQELGLETVLDLKQKRKQLCKPKPAWYKEQIAHYEQELAKFEKSNPVQN